MSEKSKLDQKQNLFKGKYKNSFGKFEKKNLWQIKKKSFGKCKKRSYGKYRQIFSANIKKIVSKSEIVKDFSSGCFKTTLHSDCP